MNEAETRAELIDPLLAAAGWGVLAGSRIRREYPITLGRLEGAGKRGKALSADYVLEYRNTKLAVVEAKAAYNKAADRGIDVLQYGPGLRVGIDMREDQHRVMFVEPCFKIALRSFA